MSDGLTVPFALAAGLAGAVTNHWLIVIGGVSEVAAGSIAMGMGGYLAAKSDADSYRAEVQRERQEVLEVPDVEREEVAQIFSRYGLRGQPLQAAVAAISADNDVWVQFMMRGELGLEEPDPKRALRSSLTIAGSYIGGGVLPLLPYFWPTSITTSLILSAVITAIALAIFGWVKGKFTGVVPVRGAFQTVLIGGLAAGAAYVIARLISGVAG
jgi:VIT1/CCC1 family predicted Fe2+/Mn2+ transporter